MTKIIFALPTITGPTGLITMPTAESLKYKEVNMGYDYIITDDPDNDQWFYKANLGTFENVELGVVGGSQPEEGMFLNAKYFLVSDASRYAMSMAVGVQNLSSENDTDIYMVASKPFEGGFKAHMGFNANFNNSEVDPSFMIGGEYYLDDKILLMSDMDANNDQYFVNFGGGYFIYEEIFLRANILDLFDKSTIGTRYSVGIAFTKFI